MKKIAWNLATGLCVAATVVACSHDSSDEGKRSFSRGDSAVAPSGGSAPAAGSPKAPAKTNYVGLQYDSLPADFHYEGGSVIPPQPGNADYDLAHVATPSGDMVLLDTIGATVGRGLRARIVRAELLIPPVANDERLFLASCDVNNKLDPGVVALVVNEPGAKRFAKVRQAWRVNIRAARFDIIPVTGVTCEDPGS